MKLKTEIFAAVALAATFMLSTTTLAKAQSDAVRSIYAWGATVPTNIEGVHTYPAPPAGFNPLTATDEELATHGFPPRPNKQADPSHYDIWARAMMAARIRPTGDLRPIPSSGRQGMGLGQAAAPLVAQTVTGPTQLTSTQFSGVASTNKLTKWNTKISFADVFGTFTLPTVQSPFGLDCVGDYDLQTWIGIDGFGPGQSYLALGGGILMDCQIEDGVRFSDFYAIVAWEPQEFYGSLFPNPGDIMYVETFSTLGGRNPVNVFIEDLTQLTYQSFSITATHETPPLIGNSAEWTVGVRKFDGTGDTPLANTIGIFFGGAEAYTANGHQFFPGSTSPLTEVFTLLDPTGTQAIEIVSSGSSGSQGKYSLWFQTTGCAYSGGCAP